MPRLCRASELKTCEPCTDHDLRTPNRRLFQGQSSGDISPRNLKSAMTSFDVRPTSLVAGGRFFSMSGPQDRGDFETVGLHEGRIEGWWDGGTEGPPDERTAGRRHGGKEGQQDGFGWDGVDGDGTKPPKHNFFCGLVGAGRCPIRYVDRGALRTGGAPLDVLYDEG